MKARDLVNILPSQIEIGIRVRQLYPGMAELKTTIKDKGLLQPITVSRIDDGKYKLIAGGRRTKAILELVESGELPKTFRVPALVRDIEDEIDLRECELIENLYREDLQWLEKIQAIEQLHALMVEKHGPKKWQQRDTAKLLDKSLGGFNRCLQLASAIKRIPKLRECKTEDEAVKALRKLQEALEVRALKKSHDERILEDDEDYIDEDDDGSVSFEVTTEKSTKPKVDPRVKLIQRAANHYQVGDARVGMREMLGFKKKAPIAFVEVDPPYAIDLINQKETDTLETYEEVDAGDYPEFLEEICDLIFQVTPDNVRGIFWFGIEWYDEVSSALNIAGFDIDPIPCIWTKPTGQTNSPDRYLARCWESFFVFTKGNKPPPIAKRGRSNVFAFDPVPAKTKYHPTQRPPELMDEILATFAWTGTLMMVPFLGSAQTLLSGYKMGITGFGWDLSRKYQERFIAEAEKEILGLKEAKSA